ncbi:MobA/MobL family protein [Escherichia coli]|uniref:MobA/MobL family protein n=1 Tax=Escherichia coli TaxID=562 RepID=UPI00389043F8
MREFVRQEIGDRHAYQWALHVPTAADGGEQPHFHLMFSERQVDGIDRDPEQYFKRYNAKAPEKGGARKGYGPSAGQTLTKAERAAELKELRGRWEAMCNAHWSGPGWSSASTCAATPSAAPAWSRSASSCRAPGAAKVAPR